MSTVSLIISARIDKIKHKEKKEERKLKSGMCSKGAYSIYVLI